MPDESLATPGTTRYNRRWPRIRRHQSCVRYRIESPLFEVIFGRVHLPVRTARWNLADRHEQNHVRSG